MCLAIPGCVLSVDGDALTRTARVDFGGAIKEINLAYTPEAQVGDYVLVHVGFALTVLDAERAEETLRLLHDAAAEGSRP